MSISALLLLLLIICTVITPKTATAASSISITDINYLKSSITIKVNDADTKVYFSDSKKTMWEVVPGEIGSDRTITMDISWVSISQNYIITFKGDASTEVVSVIIPKQVTNLKANYSKVKGTVSFANAETRKIEWRKKGSTIWNTVDTSALPTEISYLYNNGAILYFRLAPINGTSPTNVGFRPSKEVTVSIPKKMTSPTITINGSAFTIPVKKGMAYRTVYSDSTTSDWTTIGSTTDLLLESIASNALYRSDSTTQSKVTLQFRTDATSSTQVSKITTVTVPVQAGPPNEDTYGISLSYTSSSSISLQVKAASSAVPFEYTIIDAEDELDDQTVTWKTISSSAAINLNDDAAPEGSHIYVRKKTIVATTTIEFALASVEVDVSGSNGLEYPEATEATSLITLISTAGVCKTTDSSSYLSFSLYSATSTTVSSIEFLDVYDIAKGTVTCKSTVAKNSSSTGSNDKYIITTKINSTANLDSVTEELLYAKITLGNSDVITSSDTVGVRLYLYPNTTVNIPQNEDENENFKDYTDNFSRVYLSTDPEDDSNFKFQLDFGTKYIPDSSISGNYTSTAVAISTMKYDGYTLSSGADYTVSYGSYVNDDDETIATATVTVNVAKFEDSSLINTTNKALPLVIKLNNGEVLKEDVAITLINTATLNSTPIAWSITEGSLKETKTFTVTNSDASTTTVTEEVITYTLNLTLFDSSYGVSVSDITWGGISIFGSAKITGGSAIIYLSNTKINKLATTSTDTKNIVITLSNGFKIMSGCKLTILDGTD